MVRWRILGKEFLQMGQMILGGTIAARTVGPGGTVDGALFVEVVRLHGGKDISVLGDSAVEVLSVEFVCHVLELGIR